MSDDYIHIIPEQAEFLPAGPKRDAAVAYFRSIAPAADEITATVTDRLEFIHCGSNFGRIGCPSCRREIELSTWQDWMDADYDGTGFQLAQHPMPCCGARHTLHDLAYEWPLGFAHCDICAMNPDIGKLSDEQRARFEAILGCRVRVIYEHL